ncbi:MAG TPA: TRAP transporter substrate-binding protein [Geminicoccaceae bacterium]|nr:TRAP transporter substrate-binding protein [Geminicoccaceae bacterium]
MSQLTRRQFGAAAGAIAAASIIPVRGRAAEVLKFGHITDEENTWHLAAMEFARLVNEKTGGEVQVEVYPNSSLGTERELLEGIPLGIADMTISSDSMAQWAPRILLMSHLFTFRDADHVLKFMESPVAESIEADLIEQARLRPITYFLRGPRHLTSNRPIETVADVQGFKLRVPDVRMFIADWAAIGANPTPMAFAEVFGALQQGVVDGQENPLALIASARFYEVQRYLNLTAHVRQAIYVVVGEDRFQSLQPDYQQAILAAAEETQAFEREKFEAAEAELEQLLRESGMTFVETDVSGFKEAVQSTIPNEFPEFVEDMQAIQAL